MHAIRRGINTVVLGFVIAVTVFWTTAVTLLVAAILNGSNFSAMLLSASAGILGGYALSSYNQRRRT